MRKNGERNNEQHFRYELVTSRLTRKIRPFLAAIIFEMIWTQIHARRITAGQISVTDVARPRFRVPPGLLFALAVPRYMYIDRFVAVHLVYERVLRLLPDISNFDNSSAGVITALRNVNDDRKTIRRRVLMADASIVSRGYTISLRFVLWTVTERHRGGNDIVLAQGFSKWSVNSLFSILDWCSFLVQILGVNSCGIQIQLFVPQM